jgi:hypothetical protein
MLIEILLFETNCPRIFGLNGGGIYEVIAEEDPH